MKRATTFMTVLVALAVFISASGIRPAMMAVSPAPRGSKG